MRHRILVTGAAGFIGSHLSESLVQRGYQVVGFDNLSYGSLENLSTLVKNSRFKFVKGDVRDLGLLIKEGINVDVIIHLAAYKIPRYGNALETLKVNVKGVENVLKVALKGKCKVVFASTSDVYGKNPHIPYSEESDFYLGSPQVQRWSYAISKILGEHLCFMYFREHDVQVSVLRYFGSYGPKQNLTWWGGPQAIFIDCALQNKPLPIHGDGHQTRSFIYIQDTIEGTVRCLDNDKSVGKTINIGSEEEITILELGKKIWKLTTGSETPLIKYIPYRTFPNRYEDVRRRRPDIRLAKEILGFHPKYSLEEGLSLTIEWQKRLPRGK